MKLDKYLNAMLVLTCFNPRIDLEQDLPLLSTGYKCAYFCK